MSGNNTNRSRTPAKSTAEQPVPVVDPLELIFQKLVSVENNQLQMQHAMSGLSDSMHQLENEQIIMKQEMEDLFNNTRAAEAATSTQESVPKQSQLQNALSGGNRSEDNRAGHRQASSNSDRHRD